jgi:hypothetical protein
LPDQDFVFALEIADDADSGHMLGELCMVVLGHVGYAAPAIAELTRDLRAALGTGGGNGTRRCDVRFVAQGGSLQIVVSRAGAAEWRTSRPLPAP